jgi:uncharacterized cupredoxin-like copper-binding protein
LLTCVLIGAGIVGANRPGLAQDATPEAALNPVDVAHPAHVHTGSCADLGEVVEPLSDLTRTQGEAVGAPGAIIATRSFTTVPIPFDDLLADDYALNVHLSAEAIDTYLACGEIGGVVDVNGALTIGLKDIGGRGHTGIAYLAPGTEEGTTDILIFMTETDAPGTGVAAATPLADGTTEAPTPEPTEVFTEETVEVSLTEWAINMPTELEAGTVIFEVINDGTVPHTFQIAGETLFATLEAPIGPGETALLTVDLAPGAYTVICPLGDGAHRDIGMLLEITVE